MHKAVVIAVGALAAGAAGAQPKPQPQKPAYESTFKDYRRWSEPELESWRKANEQVRRLGGHKGHTGEKKK